MEQEETEGFMKRIFAAALALLTVIAPALACPVGSRPAVDNWGNQTCVNVFSGQTVTITAPSNGGCPVGTHPFVDNWGNPVCQSFQNGSRYYDTSKGCPIGTHPFVDNWGNPVCQR